MITLFKSYFNTFDEDSLRNNFVLIYELLDGASARSAALACARLTRALRCSAAVRRGDGQRVPADSDARGAEAVHHAAGRALGAGAL